MDNNSPSGRGGRDSDNWNGRGGGRDSDKWGGRGGSRDSDGWGGRGSRLSPWRGNGNRRRNDDWEGPNQKRWRRDDNPEWEEQQKPWKRGTINEEEEWQNNKQGAQWAAGKKDEGNFSKYKNRDNNEERPRKPSKWGDKEPDDKVKEDHWNKKSAEHTSSKDESNAEEGPHQTSAPMDLDNYEGESVDNIEQPHKAQEQETSNLSNTSKEQGEFEKVQCQDETESHDLDRDNELKYDQGKDNFVQNVDKLHNNENQQFKDSQNNFNNKSQELSHNNYSNVEEPQQDLATAFKDNIEQPNMEQHHDKYKPNYEFEKDSQDNFNSQHEYETNQNDRGFEQNQQFESERPNYDQSYDDNLKHHSNSEEQNMTNDFAPQVDEGHNENYSKVKSQETQNNFYFGADSEPITNKSVEVEQQNNDILPNEESGIADNNELCNINTAELNQS